MYFFVRWWRGEVYGRCPIPWPEGVADVLDCLHPEGVLRCAAFNFFKFNMRRIPPLFSRTRKMELM
jgi:hypothetical protein